MQRFTNANKGLGCGPLHTIQELATEFGVKPRALVKYISDHAGPKWQRRVRSTSGMITYYNLREMRAWWATVKDKVRK